LVSYQVAIKQVAQTSRLCKRRLKPAATKNISLIATGYQALAKNLVFCHSGRSK
jgi:hypothetical protein